MSSNSSNLRQRSSTSKSPSVANDDDGHSASEHAGHTHENGNGNSEHHHSHTHSTLSTIFGHTHSHGDGPSEDVQSIVKVFEGKADAGSKITLIGLVTNIGLTLTKGAAGWMMNSAALLAEAGHSASDMLGDIVTLFAWKLARRPPTEMYPYGFGKFETLGTTTVALILIGGAVGIGVHSFTLLTHHLIETTTALPPGPAHTILQNVTDTVQTVATAIPSATAQAQPHTLTHGHDALALDPNAAWFALISVIIKEWIYRATKRVADAERSSVLLANAIHHRSDAYTSAVALVAILGTWAYPALPLDPIGGLLVAFLIFKQGVQLFIGAFGELTDAGVSTKTRKQLLKALGPLLEQYDELKEVDDVRALRSGALLFVDIRMHVQKDVTVGTTFMLEQRIKDALISVRSDVFEVRVKFIPVDVDRITEEEVAKREENS